MYLLKPSVAGKVETAQARQKFRHDQRSKSRSFEVGHAVEVRNYTGNEKWSYGTVVERTGPASVEVKLHYGTVVRRHYDQLLITRKPPVATTRGVLNEPEFQSTDTTELAAPVLDLPS